MTTLSPQDRDLVLWVLNNKPVTADAKTTDENDLVIRLSRSAIRNLGDIIDYTLDEMREDRNRCFCSTSGLVIDQQIDILQQIGEALDQAKPLVSTQASNGQHLPDSI